MHYAVSEGAESMCAHSCLLQHNVCLPWFVLQLVAIMLAGYETSVSVTCVALHLLPKYPEVYTST
jgi:hypothetical protein